MKEMIFSDNHGDVESLEALEKAQKEESPDRTICLGDTIGYGTHHNECFERTHDMCDVYLLGNHELALKKAQEHRTGDIVTEDDIHRVDPLMNLRAKQALAKAGAQLEEVNIVRLERLKQSHENGRVLYVHGSPQEPVSWTYVFPADVFMEFLEGLEGVMQRKGIVERVELNDKKAVDVYRAILRLGPVQPQMIADETGIDLEYVNRAITSMLTETPLLKASLKMGMKSVDGGIEPSFTGNVDARFYMGIPKYTVDGYMEHCKLMGKDDPRRMFYTFNMPADMVFRIGHAADMDGFFVGHSHTAFLTLNDGTTYRGAFERVEVPEGVRFVLNPGTASRAEKRVKSEASTYAVYETDGSKRYFQINRIGG